MLPMEEARNSLEFKRFFVIFPELPKDQACWAYGGETGKPLAEDFSYASDTNDEWFGVDDLKSLDL